MSNGFIVLDLSKLKEESFSIEMTSASSKIGLKEPSKLNLLQKPELGHHENSMFFSYAVPQYNKFNEVSYQYRLDGLFNEWSPFTKENQVSFNNLKFGDYTFQVRGKVGNTLTNNTASYSFKIRRPWYWSLTAIFFYVLATISLFYGIHRLYKRYYTKKQERLFDIEKKRQKRKKLKAEKQLIKLRNEKLRAEVDSKSRELAVSTMSMIKKNEFLNTIKSQLEKVQTDNTDLKSVIQMIDNNLNNSDDWKFFEEAFNNADKNFLKKIKELHPEMTPSDLKLCAYLRLNLSSKEIAPLLNISVKSVEVKRYRLRKKMNLPHENSLTEYILSL